MNSSTFFKTKNEACYLYDTNQQQLLNVHPIMETIHHLVNAVKAKEIMKQLNEKYPELTDLEIRRYLKKYDFLKFHGFFAPFDFDHRFVCHTTAKQVENEIIHLDAITFEVTSDCNLNCRYCCYGELYNHEQRTTQYMKFDTIQTFFRYIIPYWNLNPNQKLITIGFYGGEPLLNFSLIEKTVELCDSIKSEHLEFNFTITTNAVLLNKYADFLVKYNFKILFSLDGNEKGNSLRVDKNGRSSFVRVFDNIKKLQNKYPDFFKRKVDFNSVLNQFSSTEDVNNFIFTEFGKIPRFSRISDVGLKKDKVKEYLQIMRPYIETEELMSLRYDKSSRLRELGSFFYYSLNNSYKHFSEIVHFNKRNQKKLPTGTCLPFYKKMFIYRWENLCM